MKIPPAVLLSASKKLFRLFVENQWLIIAHLESLCQLITQKKKTTAFLFNRKKKKKNYFPFTVDGRAEDGISNTLADGDT